MNTFFFIGKYSAQAIKEASADRTVKAGNLIADLGGSVKSIHALLGDYDLAIVAELPSVETAMKASLGLSMLSGISFKTLPAVSVEDFDKIIGEK